MIEKQRKHTSLVQLVQRIYDRVALFEELVPRCSHECRLQILRKNVHLVVLLVKGVVVLYVNLSVVEVDGAIFLNSNVVRVPPLVILAGPAVKLAHLVLLVALLSVVAVANVHALDRVVFALDLEFPHLKDECLVPVELIVNGVDEVTDFELTSPLVIVSEGSNGSIPAVHDIQVEGTIRMI